MFWNSSNGDEVSAKEIQRRLKSAKKLQDAGSTEQALAEFRQLAEITSGREDLKELSLVVRFHMASLLRDSGQLNEAIEICSVLIPDFAEVLGESDEQVIIAKTEYALLLDMNNQTDTAIQVLTSTIDATYEPRTDSRLIQPRAILATFTSKVGNIDLAIHQFDEIIEDASNELGRTHDEVLNLYGLVLDELMSHKDLERFLLYATVAVEIFTEKYGENSEAVLQLRSQIESAIAEIKPDNIAQTPDPNQQQNVQVDLQKLMELTQRVWTLEDAGNLDEALKVCAQLESLLGPRDELTIAMATTLVHGNRTKDVINAYQRYLPQKKAELGEDHPDYLTLCHNYAIFLSDVGLFDESVSVWEDLIPRRTRILGVLDPLTLLSRMNYVLTLLQKQETTKVIELAPLLIKDLSEVYGAEDSRVVKHRQHYLLALHLNDPSSTVELYKELIDDQIRVYGKDSVEVMLSRINLAQGLVAKGESDKALWTLQSALPDAVRVYGENHPLVLQIETHIRELIGK